MIRVFGGPGIGDVRSRLVRLIPDTADAEKAAIKAFFNHRLPDDPNSARHEWLDIVEGKHVLWTDISSEKRELIRSFLNTLNMEILRRARPTSTFNFQSASVGNLFLTGARLFTGSFEASIYLFGSITGIPPNVKVLPAINSNFSHHICAGLADGSSIAGQNSISHPSAATTIPLVTEAFVSQRRSMSLELDRVEDANLPGSLPTLRKQYISFQKEFNEELPSRIERVWYINPYGQEIRPSPNPKVLDVLSSAQCVIYSIGSLYTSIVPCLVLKDVGEAIASSKVRQKILILNGSIDRETGPVQTPFAASQFVEALANACYSSSRLASSPPEKMADFQWRRYVTHVIHLEGAGTPVVDKENLKSLGIESVRLYGRKAKNGMVYDAKALTQALEAIIGSKRDLRSDQSRRNTLQG